MKNQMSQSASRPKTLKLQDLMKEVENSAILSGNVSKRNFKNIWINPD